MIAHALASRRLEHRLTLAFTTPSSCQDLGGARALRGLNRSHEAAEQRLRAERDEAQWRLRATGAEQLALQQELAQLEMARDEMEHDLYKASECLSEAGPLRWVPSVCLGTRRA